MQIQIKRLIAGIIDLYIICFISSFIVLIITLGKMDIFLSVGTYLITFFVQMVFKDMIFGNASIGKKIIKIKVVTMGQNGNINTGKLSALVCLKRAMPLILLPLELLLIITNNKRMGNMWANTTVVNN